MLCHCTNYCSWEKKNPPTLNGGERGEVLVSSPKLPQFCRRLLLHRSSHFFAESAYFSSAFYISLLCLYILFSLFVDLWHLILASTPCGLNLWLVLSCAPSTPVSPSPQKPTFSNSNSTRNQVDEEPLSECTTSKSLFIYNSFLAVVASGMVVVCKQCSNSQQRWDLQWIVESIQPIRLWRPCVMRVRGPKKVGRAVQTNPTLL